MVELAGQPTSCSCGRSIARPDGDGHVYSGPARPSILTLVHAPELKAMVYREVDVEHSNSLRRAEIGPLNEKGSSSRKYSLETEGCCSWVSSLATIA